MVVTGILLSMYSYLTRELVLLLFTAAVLSNVEWGLMAWILARAFNSLLGRTHADTIGILIELRMGVSIKAACVFEPSMVTNNQLAQ